MSGPSGDRGETGASGDNGTEPGGHGPPGPRRKSRDDDPVLPDTTRDGRDIGWGDEPGERDDEWYRRERPPHHE